MFPSSASVEPALDRLPRGQPVEPGAHFSQPSALHGPACRFWSPARSPTAAGTRASRRSTTPSSGRPADTPRCPGAAPPRFRTSSNRVRSSRIPPLQSFLDFGERQVLGERTKVILTRHPVAVAVALTTAGHCRGTPTAGTAGRGRAPGSTSIPISVRARSSRGSDCRKVGPINHGNPMIRMERSEGPTNG